VAVRQLTGDHRFISCCRCPARSVRRCGPQRRDRDLL